MPMMTVMTMTTILSKGRRRRRSFQFNAGMMGTHAAFGIEQNEQEVPEIRIRRSAATRRTIETTSHNSWRWAFKPFAMPDRFLFQILAHRNEGSNRPWPAHTNGLKRSRPQREDEEGRKDASQSWPHSPRRDGLPNRRRAADRQWPLLGPALEIIPLAWGAHWL